MARLNVLAGDFKITSKYSHWFNGYLLMKRNGKFFREKIYPKQIESVQLASEEAVISLGGAAAFGTAGAVLLGPVGLLAGLVLGSRGNDTTFICKLMDGRKFMATARTRVFKELERQLIARAF